MTEIIEGKIAAILDKTTVVINRGRDHGIVPGNQFYIYSELGPFPDPDSGDELGTITRVWGQVEATTVEDRLCLARTMVGGGFHIPALQRLFNTRIELPIHDRDLAQIAETVSVGFRVRHERHPPVELEENTKSLPSAETGNENSAAGTDEERGTVDYAEGLLEEMGPAFRTIYGSGYALISESSPKIEHVLTGDHSLLHAHIGSRVSVWGKQTRSATEETPSVLDVAEISSL
jgi:hypothetical protein